MLPAEEFSRTDRKLMNSQFSRFAKTKGVMLAADLRSEKDLRHLLDQVGDYVDVVKLGNSLLYMCGAPLIGRLKTHYSLPIVADLKLTDVSHIATRVVRLFRDEGADAVILTGLCGSEVLRDAVEEGGSCCEIWAFTEFTHDSGLIDVQLANQTVRTATRSGVVGLQVPGTRPFRIEDVRTDVGEDIAIVACGIGMQGGRFGSAIAAGANLEIIGRAIYATPSPQEAAEAARRAIRQTPNDTSVDTTKLRES